MRKIFSAIIVIICATSCSKKDDVTPTIDPPIIVVADTLGIGWSITNSFTAGTLNDVFFANNTIGYACGGNGIFKSTDGGTIWSNISTTADYLNIGAFGSNVCFVKNNNMPIRSQDYGVTLQSTGYNSTSSTNFSDCFFSSQNICYLATLSSIWKSVNGGTSFSKISNTIINSTSPLSSIYFINDNKGWIHNGSIYKTENGGTDWTLLNTLTANITPSSLEFLNDNAGFIGSQGTFLKTTNGGATWTNPVPVSSATNAYTDIDFINTSIGYLSCGNSIYKTNDGGTTWSKIVGLANKGIIEIHFTDANHGWACTTDGKILKYVL